MLTTLLKLFRPSVALTALILLGGWQGYSLMHSLPERIDIPGWGPAEKQQQPDEPREQPSEETETEEPSPDASDRENWNPVLSAIHSTSGLGRSVGWIVFYTLACFGAVPVINRVLKAESNMANAILLISFSLFGILLATTLTAFQFDVLRMLLLLCAAAYSVGLIYLLANELEHQRL